MSNSDKTFSFFKGALVGAIAGAAAGLLFAPKSGKETREDIKKLALEIGDKGKDIYLQARKKVLTMVKDLKDAGKNVDKAKYEELVNEALLEIKKDFEVTGDVAKRIGLQLREDWNEVRTALKA
jgi:gas vesicle protein